MAIPTATMLTHPARGRSVEWSEMAHAGTGQQHSFQLVLRSEDGSMLFVYHRIPPLTRHNEMTQPSIGVENVDGSDGVRIAYGLDEIEAAGKTPMKGRLLLSCSKQCLSSLKDCLSLQGSKAANPSRSMVRGRPSTIHCLSLCFHCLSVCLKQ